MTTRRTGTVFWLNVLLDHDDLDPTETLLLIALADHVDDHDQAFPSLHLLARRARVSYATAKRRMANLEERGYIARTRRHGDNGRRSTYRYRLIRRRFELDPTRAHIEPLGDPDQVQSAPWSRAHPDEPTEVPSVEPEEEEANAAAAFPDPDDRLVAGIAQRLLELRDLDLPDRPVGQRKAWLKKARRRLRTDAVLPRAVAVVGHPAAGCIGRPDQQTRQIHALAAYQRAGTWTTPPPARRAVSPADPIQPAEADTPPERTAMPATVRAALTRTAGAHT